HLYPEGGSAADRVPEGDKLRGRIQRLVECAALALAARLDVSLDARFEDAPDDASFVRLQIRRQVQGRRNEERPKKTLDGHRAPKRSNRHPLSSTPGSRSLRY